MIPSRVRRISTLLYFLVVLTLSGCSTVPMTETMPEMMPDQLAETETMPSCVVLLRKSQGREETVEVPLDGETRVQDALDAAQATKAFRNLEVVVMRPTSNPSEPVLKLACRFDRRTRQIGWESDYAVLPGDRIMVREDPTSRLDQAIGSLLGPVFGSRR